MLAVRERGVDHRAVHGVGRGDVDHVHRGIGSQRLVAGVRLGNVERLRFCLRRRLGARRNRDDVDEPEPAYGIDVMSADEAWTDKSHPEPSRHAVSTFFA